jgi:hypothetical protein
MDIEGLRTLKDPVLGLPLIHSAIFFFFFAIEGG